VEGEGDESGAGLGMGLLVGGFFGVLEQAEGGVGFGGYDVVFGGVGEAEFAEGESGFEVCGVVADGGAEGSAKDGAGGVEVAGVGGGVEDGAGIGMRPLFEEFDGLTVLRFCGEDAGVGVAGEERQQVGAGLVDAGLDALLEAGFGGVEGLAKPVGVEGGDLKDTVAALRAAGSAGEVLARAGDGGGEREVEDAEELRVVQGVLAGFTG
jgi:hypothetical protein